MKLRIKQLLREVNLKSFIDVLSQYAPEGRVYNRDLHLDNLGLTEIPKIPDDIAEKYTNAMRLKIDLSNNELTNFPKELYKMGVSELDISNNPLNDDYGISNYYRLSNLNLLNTNIHDISDEMLSTPLHYLFMDVNKLGNNIRKFMAKRKRIYTTKKEFRFDQPERLFYRSSGKYFALFYCYDDHCFALYHSNPKVDTFANRPNLNIFRLRDIVWWDPPFKAYKPVIDVFDGDIGMASGFMGLMASNNEDSNNLGMEIFNAHL
jgi:hypothetical protein